jgi:thiamine biosynthesis lipoprotein
MSSLSDSLQTAPSSSPPARGGARLFRDAAAAALRRIRPAPRAERHVAHFENVLGTSFELQVVATSADAAKRAECAALDEVDRLAEILSGYSATSELARWQTTFDVDVAVSPELAEVLAAAERWRVFTNGAFNPAAVSLVELLRDPPSAGDDTTLDADARRRAIEQRLGALNRTLWTIDRAHGTARRLTRLRVSLDAIAKGYIVDRAAARARDVEGVSQVLVNVGGDLRHHGPHAVSVAITDPHAPADNAPPLTVVHLRNEALATSGGYHRGFVANGRRVSHILDPRTGQPAEQIASVSVIAPDCATADALSTAFSVMRPHESIALADSLPGAACLIVERDRTITTNALWHTRAATPRHEPTPSRH